MRAKCDGISTLGTDSAIGSLIVNLGAENVGDKDIDPRDFDNWHVDGDWFKVGFQNLPISSNLN